MNRLDLQFFMNSTYNRMTMSTELEGKSAGLPRIFYIEMHIQSYIFYTSSIFYMCVSILSRNMAFLLTYYFKISRTFYRFDPLIVLGGHTVITRRFKRSLRMENVCIELAP